MTKRRHFTTMLQTMIICLLVLSHSSSSSPSSSPEIMTTAGKQFVVAFPPVPFDHKDYVCEIHMSSEGKGSTNVEVYEPVDMKAKFQKYIVFGYSCDRSRPVEPIKVLVFSRRNSTETSSNVYVAVPELVCYQSYYVTSTIGYSGFMVFSFGHKTTVSVDIPQYRRPFHIPCAPNKIRCQSGRKIKIKLAAYQVWSVHMTWTKTQFQNTHITSDYPISVVSGGSQCQFDAGESSVCYSSMKPTVTWGKEYFVPTMIQENQNGATLRFRYNVKKLPLTIYRFQLERSKSVPEVMLKVFKDYQTFIEPPNSKPLLIASKVTFGLYVFIRYETKKNEYDITMMSLISTEQWRMRPVYAKTGLEKYFTSYSLFFVIRIPASDIGPFKNYTWRKHFRANGWTYFTRSVPGNDIDAFEENALSKYPSILYVRGTLSKKRMLGAFSFPYDHYQVYIDGYNLENCVPTFFEPDMGQVADNDCDGFVHRLGRIVPTVEIHDEVEDEDDDVNTWLNESVEFDDSTIDEETAAAGFLKISRDGGPNIVMFAAVIVLCIVLFLLGLWALVLWYRNVHKNNGRKKRLGGE